MNSEVLDPYLGQDANNPRVVAAHRFFTAECLRSARAKHTYAQWRDSLERRRIEKDAMADGARRRAECLWLNRESRQIDLFAEVAA